MFSLLGALRLRFRKQAHHCFLFLCCLLVLISIHFDVLNCMSEMLIYFNLARPEIFQKTIISLIFFFPKSRNLMVLPHYPEVCKG